MADQIVLTFNAGSSTVKIAVFNFSASGTQRIGKGVIDFDREPLTLHLMKGLDVFDMRFAAKASADLNDVLDEALSFLSRHFDLSALVAVGHRIVHGGDIFDRPAVIDEQVMQSIEGLVPLAPIHQPQSLRLIRAVAKLRPGMTQTASFDTSFHATNNRLVRRFAIPRALHDAGIKHYGFHGLSYSFIARELSRVAPSVADKKVLVAHLGSGCSLCGLNGGISRDTSMAFSTLEGVPMATRCGAIDPGVLLHLLNQKNLAPADLEDLLYHRSGLLGVSGISGDSRVLLASDTDEAREALDLFTFRIAGEAARIANTLGGMDAIVFTAGIGEHQPQIRAAIAGHLQWLGLTLDIAANEAGMQTISAPESRVTALVLATDEEQIIADNTVGLLPNGCID